LEKNLKRLRTKSGRQKSRGFGRPVKTVEEVEEEQKAALIDLEKSSIKLTIASEACIEAHNIEAHNKAQATLPSGQRSEDASPKLSKLHHAKERFARIGNWTSTSRGPAGAMAGGFANAVSGLQQVPLCLYSRNKYTTTAAASGESIDQNLSPGESITDEILKTWIDQCNFGQQAAAAISVQLENSAIRNMDDLRLLASYPNVKEEFVNKLKLLDRMKFNEAFKDFFDCDDTASDTSSSTCV